jgi:general stress protein 26
MKRIDALIVHFLQNQHFVVVSTVDKNGFPHASCKGIVEIDPKGKIYLLDLYAAQTFANLKRNSRLSITAVNEHRFVGYCLKGKAKIALREKMPARLIEAWEKKITSRLSHRIINNLHGEKGQQRHPEALLPKPAYLIEMRVEEIINLTPEKMLRKDA